jgi:hypothetical protein
MEALHCILNLVRTRFEALKFTCSRLFCADEAMVGDRAYRVPRPSLVVD